MSGFEDLRISDDWRKLFDINERHPCSMCSKSRKYFCYTCYTLNDDLVNKIPQIKVVQKNILRYSCIMTVINDSSNLFLIFFQ